MQGELSFHIEAEPVPAARPKVGRGFAYYPKKHTAYAEFLKQYLKQVPSLQSTGPVEVRMLFVMPRYKTSDAVTHRSDLDNLVKLPLDAMTKATSGEPEVHRFWSDDHMVVHLTIMKRFARAGETAHTRIVIKTIEGDVEEYIDRRFIT
jgi:Holliday junction resolvase RusA-like endonuclease